jgi:hypothetical protein
MPIAYCTFPTLSSPNGCKANWREKQWQTMKKTLVGSRGIIEQATGIELVTSSLGIFY